MSVIPRKNILVVGDENVTVHAVEAALVAAGANLIHSTCQAVTPAMLSEKSVHLVLLNHLHHNQSCATAIMSLRTTRIASTVPILALVVDTPTAIEQVLALGAADYFTEPESIPHILSKVRVALGESLSTADATLLDITEVPHETKRSHLKILMVEDDPLLVNLLTMRMERAGFSYLVNRTGTGVADEVATFAPDVILLDLSLPDSSGLDVLRELKIANPSLPPVIIFSNRDSDEDREAAAALGVARFHVKVMTDLSKLMKEIEDLAAFQAN